MTVREAGMVVEIREQIQEDIIAYLDDKQVFYRPEFTEELCQIVCENFDNKKWHETNTK
tara:strand:- start:55 stop:231 length:177 start_codon:yes stop_codon:yes gene_type:complete